MEVYVKVYMLGVEAEKAGANSQIKNSLAKILGMITNPKEEREIFDDINEALDEDRAIFRVLERLDYDYDWKKDEDQILKELQWLEEYVAWLTG